MSIVRLVKVVLKARHFGKLLLFALEHCEFSSLTRNLIAVELCFTRVIIVEKSIQIRGGKKTDKKYVDEGFLMFRCYYKNFIFCHFNESGEMAMIKTKETLNFSKIKIHLNDSK